MAKGSFQKEEEDEEDEEHELEDTETDDDDEGDVEEEEEEEEVEYRRKKVMIRVVPAGQRISFLGCSNSNSSSSSGGSSSNSSGVSRLFCCQADECDAELTRAKAYQRRHKVCERHAKAAVVLVSGIRQRFCQQCSKFHELSQFDDNKKSCREKLAGHNERRRKTHSDLPVEHGKEPPVSRMSGSMLKGTRQLNDGEMSIQGSPNMKHSRVN